MSASDARFGGPPVKGGVSAANGGLVFEKREPPRSPQYKLRLLASPLIRGARTGRT